MKIVRYEGRNIMKIKVVEITPEGNVILITGKNAQGKSALLNSIAFALCGKEAIPDEPLRRGAKSGSVVLDIDGETQFRVTRKFTENSTTLTVTDAAGNVVGSPQSFLERFLGAISMDPSKFQAMDPREQRRALLELLKIDFSGIDREINTIKDERTMLNRDKKAFEVNLSAMTFTEDLPEQVISVADLAAELKRRQDHNANVEQQKKKIENREKILLDLTEEMGDIETEIKNCQDRLECLKKASEQHQLEIIEMHKNTKEPENCSEIMDQIAASESTNQKIRVNLNINKISGKLEALRTEYYDKGQKIDVLEAGKQKLLADAKMPVPGLSAGEEGLLYNGIPLEQASESEQLRVAVSIAMAMNPKLRVIRSSANAFDSDSLKLISEMAEAQDYQVWLEKVDETGKVGIVIEDGQVKE